MWYKYDNARHWYYTTVTICNLNATIFKFATCKKCKYEKLRGDSPSGLAANAPFRSALKLNFLSEFK